MAVLNVCLDKIAHNFQIASKLCSQLSIELAVVVKSCSGNAMILETLRQAGMTLAADTHAENLADLEGVRTISLLNPPSSIKQVTQKQPIQNRMASEMYISCLDSLKLASKTGAYEQSRIMIPVDMGDHRDGIPASDLICYLKRALQLPHLNLAGLSANWGCMLMGHPEQKQLQDFAELVGRVSEECQWQPEIVSVGGSSILHHITRQQLPECVTRLRLGEAIFAGFNPSLQQPVPEMYSETFRLDAEVVEVLESGHPLGIGRADIHIPVEDGVSRRAVLDVGYSSIEPAGLNCIDGDVKIMRCSQDHLVVGSDTYHFVPGETLRFHLDYHALSRSLASPWVRKVYSGQSATAVA